MFLQKGNNSMGLKTSLFVIFYIDINSKQKKHSDYQVFEKGNNSKRFKKLIIYYFFNLITVDSCLAS